MTVARTSPGALLSRENVVLLIIDVQDKLLPHVVNGETVVKNIVKLVRFSRILGLPVMLIEQRKLGDTVNDIHRELPGVEPISKTQFGCFECEEFVAALEGLQRTSLVLTGIEAHICVTQTALGALPRYTVHVVSDAVGSRAADNREVAIRRMMQSGVTITSTEMLIYELLGDADTEEFSAVLELVKET